MIQHLIPIQDLSYLIDNGFRLLRNDTTLLHKNGQVELMVYSDKIIALIQDHKPFVYKNPVQLWNKLGWA